MRAITVKEVGQTTDGKRIVDAFILADTDPSPVPTTGEGIKGLSGNDIFAPFSMLFVLDGPKTYVANESGKFTSL